MRTKLGRAHEWVLAVGGCPKGKVCARLAAARGRLAQRGPAGDTGPGGRSRVNWCVQGATQLGLERARPHPKAHSDQHRGHPQLNPRGWLGLGQRVGDLGSAWKLA